MTKKVVISGYYGFENFGDEAILMVLSQELKKSGFDVTVFSKNPSNTSNKIGVNSVYTFDFKEVFKVLKSSDSLISGGGSLLQDVTSLKSLVYYLSVIACALFLKKNVIIFAQGIGPINNIFARFVTKLLLKRCSYITVRDKKSCELLQNWGIKADLVSDPVWSLDLPTHVPQNKVGIQLRSWKTLTDDYLKKLAEAVAEKFFDNEIVIYSFQDSLDLAVCKKFGEYLKAINPELKTNVISAMSIEDTLNSFSELSFLIAMRYHACLLALKYGIPTLAISYDEKVEKIANRFNLPCSFLDIEENLITLVENTKKINTQELLQKASECFFSFDKTIYFLK